MIETLTERQESYKKPFDYQITKRMPIIITVNGRSFKRLTKKLKKPYCEQFSQAMAGAMMYAIMEMQGAVFGYQCNDQITFILRNDQTLDSEPWYQNKIQKIASITSSLVTLGLYKAISNLENKIEIFGDAIFDCEVMAVPYLSEAVNNIIWKQQFNYKKALNIAAEEEISKKFSKKAAIKALYQKTIDEKKELLLHHCDIDFEDYYPISFRNGIAAYKSPTLLYLKNENKIKNKWILNASLPRLIDEKDFIFNIFLNGHDIYRAPPISEE